MVAARHQKTSSLDHSHHRDSCSQQQQPKAREPTWEGGKQTLQWDLLTGAGAACSTLNQRTETRVPFPSTDWKYPNWAFFYPTSQLTPQFDETSTDTYRHGLGAIAGSELGHDVLDVSFDGIFRDEEAFRDVPVSIPAGDVSEDLDLSAG